MRCALWVIRRLAPREWREALAGDLEEERQRRQAAGHSAGPIWATTAALGAALELQIDSLRGGTIVKRRGAILADLGSDVRVAVRSLRLSPGFTLAALAVLTLGTGAGIAMFAIVNSVVLRPLPFDEPNRLIAIGEVHHRLVARGLSNLGSVAAPNFFEWRQSLGTVENLAATSSASGFTIREGDQPEELRALRVTANLFDVLRLQPAIGRAFTTEHEIDGNHRVALISDSFWRRRFGSDPQVIGRTLRVDSGTWEVIGVMPAGFAYPFGLERLPDVFVPYAPPESARSRAAGRNYNLQVVGRLKPGVSLEQTKSELQSITAALAQDLPDWFADRTPGALYLHEATVGRVRGWMLVLLGAVGFVLLIACVNLANLMLARATTRSRESLIRAALGASRWRIARGLLVESLVLTTAGTLWGLLAAWWGVTVVRSALPATLPRIAELQIDARVVAVAAVVAAVVAVVSGLAPALRASTQDLGGALDQAGRSGIGRPRRRVGAVLMIAEVALAVVPLVGAGLFAASFWHVANIDLGLDYRNVLTVSVAPRVTAARTDGLEQVTGAQAVDEVMDRVRRLPGVDAVAALAGGLPFSGSWTSSAITVDGTTFDGPDDQVQIRRVTPDYAQVTRTAVQRGRYIDGADSSGAPLVVVLNEEAVRRFFGERDPVGTFVYLDDAPRTVIGVVGDVRVRGPETPVSPEAYLPFAQKPSASASVLVRTTQEPTQLAADVGRIVLGAVPGVPVVPSTLESQLQRMIAHRELNMHLTSVFGMIAVVIAAVGIYGVMAYTVAQQRQEIGVRMALGASPSSVMWMVLRRAALLVGTGLALGSVGSLILAGSIRAFLFEVRPHEPVVFVGVAVVLAMTGLLAAVVPARWAARVDPIIAMRQL
jgi:putative ABC transport system permease protein